MTVGLLVCLSPVAARKITPICCTTQWQKGGDADGSASESGGTWGHQNAQRDRRLDCRKWCGPLRWLSLAYGAGAGGDHLLSHRLIPSPYPIALSHRRRLAIADLDRRREQVA